MNSSKKPKGIIGQPDALLFSRCPGSSDPGIHEAGAPPPCALASSGAK